MTKRILITGASGFIGLQLLSTLEKMGDQVSVIAISRPLSRFKLDNFKCIEKIIISENLFLEDFQWWEKIIFNVDIFIHSAWYLETGESLNSIKNIECLEGTKKIANCLVGSNIKKFIGIGTCLEYNTSKKYLSTSTELAPKSLYAKTKTDTYIYIKELFKEIPEKFLWCRVFNIYGENEKVLRLHKYIENRLSEGKVATILAGHKIRDYMDVKDASKLIVSYALGSKFGVVNICSGVPISVMDIAQSIAKKYNCMDLLNFIPPPNIESDDDFIVGIAD